MNLQNQEEKILGLKPQHMAILLMILGPILFPLGYIYSNEHKFHYYPTTLARGVVVILITYAIAKKKNIDLTFRHSQDFRWLILRNTIMVVQGLVYGWSQFYLPLPIALTLTASSPLFAAVFDRLINGVKLNQMQVIWLLVAFIGVILTTNGNYLLLLFTGRQIDSSSTFENYLSKDPKMTMIASLVILVTMVGHAFGVVITKKLKDTNGTQINYFLGILLLVQVGPLAPYGFSDPQYVIPTMGQFIIMLFVGGIPMALGQMFYIIALTLTPNYGMLTPFMFSSIIFGYLMSVLRYGQSINIICIFGAIAIIVGIVFVVRCKDKP